MTFPLIPNGPFDVFPPKTLALGDGWHRVEAISDDGFIVVEKPGYVKEGRRGDFAVHRVKADGETKVETPSHVDLLKEFARVLQADRAECLAFASAAFRVFGGDEPPRMITVAGTQRPGDHILKALKWIWAQEDLNYPIVESNQQGRTMSGFRLQELLDGVEPETVFDRAEVKGSPPRRLSGVNYERVERALWGDERWRAV